MKDKRISVFPLIILVALAALILPSAFLQDGAMVSAAREPNPDPQVMRIGKPTPTPTPAKKSTVIIAPPSGTNKTPPPPPQPKPTQTKQGTGIIINQGTGSGNVRQGSGGMVVGPSGGKGGVLKSPPPGLPDLSKLNQKIPASELVPMENNEPITNRKPFTAAELKQKCGPGKSCAQRVIEVEGKTNVLSKGKRVPIEEYVKQLNQFEAYLNKLGYSLRTGPANLGQIVTLRPRITMPSDFQPMRPKLEMFDPATFDPDRPIKMRRDFERNPAMKLSPANSQRLQAGENYLRGVMSRPRAPSRFRLPGDSSFGAPRLIKSDLACPCIQCSEPPAPIRLGEPCLVPVDGPPPPCAGGDGGAPGKPSAPSKGVQSCGVVPKSCRAGCLYDGRLSDSWGGINQHYGANEGGWFGGDFDLFLGSSNCGMNGALNLVNGAQVTQNLYILGFAIPVIEANISTEWNGTFNPHADLKFFGVDYDPTLSFEKTIPGPSATIPIPPVPFPLVISSDFTLKLQSSPTHQNPELEVFNCNKSGTLSAGYGVNVYAGVRLDAAIDAFVARAGLTTTLVLVDDTFGLSMSSKIMPAQNVIEVAPSLNYRMLHLKGSLFFFVEVDYLFGSKRWDVLLFDYSDGIGTDGQTVNVPLGNPLRYHAAKEVPK